MKTILQSFRILIVLTILTGLAYSLAMTVRARAVFRNNREGPLNRDGRLVGSELLARKVRRPELFLAASVGG